MNKPAIPKEPARVAALTIIPPAGANLHRAVECAAAMASEYDGAAVSFEHGDFVVTVRGKGGAA